ncbi:Ig-like domain-containing protein, partial [Pseudomonas sp. NPDC090755]|uniref:Ig-like domain-containing protein n=1 Tax=Pseudomonas sp. NPDC090755 TaxID=3364481 RepID=UPI00383AC5FB
DADGKIDASGTAEPGSTVTVTWPDNSTSTVVTDGSGNWSLESPTVQESGEVSAEATDAAGNTSDSVTVIYTDTVAPNAPTLVVADADADGKIDASGTAEPGSTVTVTWPDNSTSTVVTDGSGNWSLESPTVQESGEVSAVATDAAGNVSDKTTAVFTDSFAPTVTVSIDSISTDSGVVGDFITNDADGLTVNASLSAALAAGEKLFYSNDNGATWIDVTSSVSGTAVSYVDDALTSSTTVQFRVVDAAGNAGSLASQAIVIDTVAPSTPVTPSTYADDVGSVKNPTSTALVTDDTRPGINVGAGLTDAPKLYVNGSLVSATYDSVAGTLTPDVGLADGTYAFTWTLTDVAGNESAPSGALNMSIATSVATPALSLSTDTGSSNSDKITQDGTVNVSGLEAGATWQYSTDGGTTWVAGSGTSFTLSGAGAKSVVVRQTDAAGNDSATSAPYTFTLDTSALAPSLTLFVDTGSSNSDKITQAGTVNVSGLEAGAAWQYSTDGGTTWTTGSGSSFVLSGDGAKSVVVRQTDAAGNVSAISAPFTFTLDTSALAPSLTLSADTGSSDSDKITQDGTVNVSGLEAGATWLYSTDGGSTWSAGSGTSFTLSGDGAKSVVVRQTDAAGNVSATSAPYTFTLDTVSPPLLTLALAVDTGSSDSDKITQDGTVNVSGLEAGATWEYSTDGGTTWTVGSGSSFILSDDGAKSVVVRQTDAAGNVSDASAPYTFTLDRSIAVPTIDPMAVDNDMSAAEASKAQNITGTAEAGASVTINFNGYDYTAVADASGNWGVVVPAANLTGAYTKVITVTATDVAGNVSTPATSTVWMSTSVNTTASGSQTAGHAASLADGGWVVTWESNQEIYQQRYTSAGVASGGETRVSTTDTSSSASTTGLSDGGWLVTWQSYNSATSSWDVYQQRYTSAGVASGAETQVNTYTADMQSYPSVTGLSDGGWVVTWSSLFQETGWGVYQQRYTSTG